MTSSLLRKALFLLSLWNASLSRLLAQEDGPRRHEECTLQGVEALVKALGREPMAAPPAAPGAPGATPSRVAPRDVELCFFPLPAASSGKFRVLGRLMNKQDQKSPPGGQVGGILREIEVRGRFTRVTVVQIRWVPVRNRTAVDFDFDIVP